MRNGILPDPYVTDHQHSRVVMAAVAEGVGKPWRDASDVSWRPEPAIVYGILRGCGNIIRRCHLSGIDWWHIDLGYFGRGHYEGYYRLSHNAMQTEWRRYTSERTNIPDIEDWREGGDHILLCPPTSSFSFFHPIERLSEEEWVDAVSSAIKRRTDRPIVVRNKGDDGEIGNPWCVVVHSSNIAIDSLIKGIPAIALGESVVQEWGPSILDISDYDELRSHDRKALLRCLSWHQFTLDEFRRGVPWR